MLRHGSSILMEKTKIKTKKKNFSSIVTFGIIIGAN